MKLSSEAKKWRAKLEAEFNLSDSDAQLVLVNLLEAFDELRRAQRIVMKDGVRVKDRFDQVKSHPLCSVIRDSRAQVLNCIKMLGLDVEATAFNGPGRPPGS